MYKNKNICVVMPARDEEENIQGAIESLPDYIDNVIIVDDLSGDGTSEAAKRSGRRGLEIVRTDRISGVGGATILGYKKALQSEADIIVKMDGDGQMDPSFLPGFLDALIDGNYDYAKGNRFIGKGLSGMPLVRLLANIAMTFFTKLASGYWNIFDPQNGFTAVKAGVLRNIDLNTLTTGFFFENDMLVHLNLLRKRVADVPTAAIYKNEISHVNPIVIFFTFPFLLVNRFLKRIYFNYVISDFSPVAVFLFVGSAMFFGAAIYGSAVWIRSYQAGALTPTGTIALILLPLILGFQLILQGIVLDINNTPR